MEPELTKEQLLDQYVLLKAQEAVLDNGVQTLKESLDERQRELDEHRAQVEISRKLVLGEEVANG